jgi:hypothetical protein
VAVVAVLVHTLVELAVLEALVVVEQALQTEVHQVLTERLILVAVQVVVKIVHTLTLVV